MSMDAYLVAFYVIGTISIALSCYVISCIMRMGLRSGLLQLIFFLQLTLLLQEIFSYPEVFTSPGSLCRISSGLKQYFTLANLLVNSCLSYATYRILFTPEINSHKLSPAIHVLFWLGPLPFLFAYRSYDRDGKFCSFSTGRGGFDWGLSFVLICGFVNVAAVIMSAVIVMRLLAQGERNLSLVLRVLRGGTAYCIVTVAFWIPKIFVVDYGFTDVSVGLQNSRFFTFFAGIAYFLIFVVERDNVGKFEMGLDVNGTAYRDSTGSQESSSLDSYPSLGDSGTAMSIIHTNVRNSIQLDNFNSNLNESFSTSQAAKLDL